MLKPGGRLVVVDAVHRGQSKRLGPGERRIEDQPAFLKEAGFSRIETDELPLTRLHGFSRAGLVVGRKVPSGEGSTLP
ncbi:MAG: hypothetical protein ACRDGS_07975 [Chloroflexota bacterium]